MLLSGGVGKGLEPVRHMRNSVFQSPLLHAIRNFSGDSQVERFTAVDAFFEGPEGGRIEITAHLPAAENEFSEILGRGFNWSVDRNRLFSVGVADKGESCVVHKQINR